VSENGGTSQGNYAHNSLGMAAFTVIVASHDTEIKLWICKNTDSENVYNRNHLYSNMARINFLLYNA
jgi:hypothetical protein